MKLSLEQLAASKQKQVGNILRKLADGKVAGRREMQLLEQVAEKPVVPGEKPLVNAKHERFCQALALGATEIGAYGEAGYAPNRSHASRLAKRAEIVERIAFLRERRPALLPPMLPSTVSRVRAPDASPPSAVRTMESVSLSMAAALDARFSDDVVLGHIERLLAAERSFQQDGSIVTAPDHASQIRALDLLLKYKLGLPFARVEPKASKSVDLSEFSERIRKSPAYRQGLRELLDEAEAAAKAAAPSSDGVPPSARPPPNTDDKMSSPPESAP